MIQNIIVAAIVIAAVGYVGWRAWRALRGRKTGCGCDECPAVKPRKQQ